MKSLVVAVAALAVVLGSTGCESGSDSSFSGQGTNVASASPGQGGVTAPPTESQYYHSPQPSAPAQPVTTTLPSRDDATVDARDYKIGDKFYFQSPSGNIKCGFINDSNFGTGCQLKDAQVIPADLQGGCENPTHKVAAQVKGATAEFLCLNQGVFVGMPQNTQPGYNEGGGKVLNYGETIIVMGAACTSLESGVRCDQGGHGFFIAADQQHLF